jgi:hypothetical protein
LSKPPDPKEKTTPLDRKKLSKGKGLFLLAGITKGESLFRNKSKKKSARGIYEASTKPQVIPR